MFKWLKKQPPVTHPPANAEQHRATKSAETANKRLGADNEFAIGRQPILNSQHEIVAYELLFRRSTAATGAYIEDDVAATSDLLVNLFNNLGLDKVLGTKKGFINVSTGLLEQDVLELLPPDKVVFEILEHVEPTPSVIERCSRLKQKGYLLALDDFVYKPEMEPLLALASYVKIDIQALGLAATETLVRQLRARGKGLRLLAEKVETLEEFEACRKMLITHYQGYYFARPHTLSSKRVDPAAQQLIGLFNMVKRQAEPNQIESQFKRDVALTYNLLRFINSAGMGVARRITSVKHAIVLLGYEKLARWVSLLMLSGQKNTLAPQALFKTALIRARATELIGGLKLPASDADQLFITGMFSLLDVVLDLPMDELLKNLELPEAVRSALLTQEGPYAPYLALSQACESLDIERIAGLIKSAGLVPEDVTRAQLEAMGWAEQLEGAA